jgi:uncharacterized protein YjeT (DUF2065 family)
LPLRLLLLLLLGNPRLQPWASPRKRRSALPKAGTKPEGRSDQIIAVVFVVVLPLLQGLIPSLQKKRAYALKNRPNNNCQKVGVFSDHKMVPAS